MLKILGVRRKQVQNSLGNKKHVRLKSRHYACTEYGTWKYETRAPEEQTVCLC